MVLLDLEREVIARIGNEFNEFQCLFQNLPGLYVEESNVVPHSGIIYCFCALFFFFVCKWLAMCVCAYIGFSRMCAVRTVGKHSIANRARMYTIEEVFVYDKFVKLCVCVCVPRARRDRK